MPIQLEKTVQMFEAFYSKQFSGRKLTWLHHLSNGDVKLNYTAKGYIINMSTTQVGRGWTWRGFLSGGVAGGESCDKVW